jgi:hypothetical protein
MIGYRFLAPAEEEMTEASVFYEAAAAGLGSDFFDDVQRVIDTLRPHPALGTPVGRGLRRALLHRFPFSLIYSGRDGRNPGCCRRASETASWVLER